MIQFSAFYKIGSRLMELKRNALVYTLATDIQNPFVMKRPHIDTRFAGTGYLADTAVQILFKIDRTKHRTENDRFVLDRKLRKDRQAEISTILIFAGASYNHIIIAVSPVSRYTFQKAFDTLRKKIEHTITAAFYHFPALITPFVCIFQQKIRGETGHDNRSGRDLHRSVSFLFDRQIEILCFAALLRRNRTPVCFILPINIAETASFGILRTTVPGIPAFVFLFAHFPIATPNALQILSLSVPFAI